MVSAVIVLAGVAACGESPREQATEAATVEVRAYSRVVRDVVGELATRERTPAELADAVAEHYPGEVLESGRQGVVTGTRVDGDRAVARLALYAVGSGSGLGSANVWVQSCVEVSAVPGEAQSASVAGADCPETVRGTHPRADAVVPFTES